VSSWKYFPYLASLLISWHRALEFIKHARREPRIHNVICQHPEITRSLHGAARIFETTQPKHLLIKIGRKCPQPGLQLLGHEGVEYPSKRILYALSLIAGRLVNKRDDANARNTPNQNLALPELSGPVRA